MSTPLMLALSLLVAGPVELIAHRGESADAPENSLAAFRDAVGPSVPLAHSRGRTLRQNRALVPALEGA